NSLQCTLLDCTMPRQFLEMAASLWLGVSTVMMGARQIRLKFTTLYWTSGHRSRAPTGWNRIGDAPCCVLPDGRVLLGSIDDTRSAIYDPVTNDWAASANKDDSSSEETWTLLSDQTVLTAECENHPRAEKYVIPANVWTTAGTLPVDLVESSSIEIGPAFL